jgi:hypothetical protein
MQASSLWVATFTLLGVTGLGGCSDQDQPEKAGHLSCEQQEFQEYPALEKVAATTLGGQRHTPSRAGACEDTGSPRATVQAIVRQWHSRSVGEHFLKTHGWRNYRSGLLLSEDKKYAAESSESRAADAQTSVVVLTFTKFIGS